jgi:hypothetical protein
MSTPTIDHQPTPNGDARSLLDWLLAQRVYRAGTLRKLCAGDPEYAKLWASMPYGLRRKTGRTFNRLVRERARRLGEPLLWCYNLPADKPNTHACYAVLPARP